MLASLTHAALFFSGCRRRYCRWLVRAPSFHRAFWVKTVNRRRGMPDRQRYGGASAHHHLDLECIANEQIRDASRPSPVFSFLCRLIDASHSYQFVSRLSRPCIQCCVTPESKAEPTLVGPRLVGPLSIQPFQTGTDRQLSPINPPPLPVCLRSIHIEWASQGTFAESHCHYHDMHFYVRTRMWVGCLTTPPRQVCFTMAVS